MTVLLGSAALGACALWVAGRIPQDPAYHRFADTRSWLGIPNALNVLSNVAFAIVGAVGLSLVLDGSERTGGGSARRAWQVLFAAVLLTSLGSAWYHVAPSNETLVWDRLPMAIGFMALLSAIIGERVDARLGARLLWPLGVLGVAGVVAWILSERAGAGDLRPYILVQYWPLVAIPLLLVVCPRADGSTQAFLFALGFYVLAKVAEVADEPIFRLLRVVSGHTLKHLLAAAGIGAFVWLQARRRIVPEGTAPIGEAVQR
jgi:hypothetical protein